eukprot:11823714-Heterocapsa_arctica.AAC.1
MFRSPGAGSSDKSPGPQEHARAAPRLYVEVSSIAPGEGSAAAAAAAAAATTTASSSSSSS